MIRNLLAGPTTIPVSKIKAVTPQSGSWLLYSLSGQGFGGRATLLMDDHDRVLHVISIDRMDKRQALHLAEALGIPYRKALTKAR